MGASVSIESCLGCGGQKGESGRRVIHHDPQTHVLCKHPWHSEMSTPYIEANGLHSAPSAMAVEFETADFLYGLVRLLKPKIIIETGTGEAHSTQAMARAAKDNGFGFVYSCETDYAISTAANKILDQDFAHSDYCDGEEECSNLEKVDFAFLDSSGDRVAECAALQLSPKGVVVLHDSKRPEYKPIWTMRPWASIWEIDTPRGLTVFAL